MKKFFNLAAHCLAPLFLAAIFSCSNNGDAPVYLTQTNGTQQTGGQQADGQAAQTNFLTDWETMEFLCINDNGTLNKKIEAPWNKEAAATLMPESVRFDVKKEDGWEAAFNLMNKDGHPDMNYFGLYNKYTGALRIFYYYNKDVASTATDFAFEVVFETDGSRNQPYYSALSYGIPMNTEVKTNLNFLVAGNTSKTFHLLITPYSGIDRHEMTQGWYAFDIDMSAYTGKSYYTDGSPIKISCRANNKTKVTLGTEILGKIGGDFNGKIEREKLQATSNGTSGLLSDIAGGSSSIGKALSSTADALDKGGPAAVVAGIGAVFDWVACGLNIAAICKKDRSAHPQQPDKMSGKIDLKLNATAETQGYLETSVATNVKQFTLEKAAFNPESNVGKGVWNIDKSPVVYFITDRIMDSGEIAYFYDPTSFEVALNKDAFPDVTNLKVISFCGIYERDGNKTRNIAFREALGLGSLEKTNINIECWSQESDVLLADDSPNIDLFGGLTIKECRSEDFTYKGFELSLNDENAVFNFIVQPRVKPTNAPKMYPELYVVVAILFESNGKQFFYSRRYLPKAQEIGYKEAKTILTNILGKLKNEQEDKLYKDKYTDLLNSKLSLLNTPSLDPYDPK